MKIYQCVSKSSSNELSPIDDEFITNVFNNDLTFIFPFDGVKAHWEIGDFTLITIITTEDIIKKIESIDFEYNGTVDKFYDITKDVLYDNFDMNIFGFAKEKMMIEFHKYKNIYLDKDLILDKINELGIESLNINDKLILQDENTVSPLIFGVK